MLSRVIVSNTLLALFNALDDPGACLSVAKKGMRPNRFSSVRRGCRAGSNVCLDCDGALGLRPVRRMWVLARVVVQLAIRDDPGIPVARILDVILRGK